MNVIKNLTVLVFFILSSLSGPLYISYLRKECYCIQKIISTLQYMSDIIAYKRLTLYQSIEECYKKEQMFFLKNVMMNIENNSNYTEVWNQSIISDNELPNECKNILIDFGKVLGKTNLKSQIGFFSYYIKQLQELNISKKTALSSKSKLYNSIGVLIGAFIVIIFI